MPHSERALMPSLSTPAQRCWGHTKVAGFVGLYWRPGCVTFSLHAAGDYNPSGRSARILLVCYCSCCEYHGELYFLEWACKQNKSLKQAPGKLSRKMLIREKNYTINILICNTGMRTTTFNQYRLWM